MSTTYTEENGKEIAELLVGRRIVAASTGVEASELSDMVYSHYGDVGRLTLDNGTELVLTGHDGSCDCSAGCYELTSVAEFDNVITSAQVICSPSGDGMDGDGHYRIFVFADSEAMQVADFEGSDGNGYYGTGFWLVVKPSS